MNCLKQNKNQLLAISICCLLFILSGCFPTNKRNFDENSAPKKGLDKLPSHIKKKIGDNLTIDAAVSNLHSKHYHTQHASLRNFTQENLNTIILQNEDIQTSETVENELYPLNFDTVLTGTKGSTLRITLGGFSYRSPQDIIKPYGTVLSNFDLYQTDSLKRIFTKEALPTFDKLTAVQIIHQKLESLNITNISEKLIIPLDYETLQNQYQELNIELQNNKQLEPFTQEDEAYLIIYESKVDDLPVTSSGYFGKNKDGNVVSCLGSRIEAIVTKNDIISFDVSNLYEIQSTVENKNNVDLTYIIEKIEKKYADIILDSPLEIKEINLEYLPVAFDTAKDERKLQPYWVFTLNQKILYDDEKGKTEINESFPLYFSYYDGSEMEVEEYQ